MQPQALSTAEPIKAAAATARAVSTHGRTLPQEPAKPCAQSPRKVLQAVGHQPGQPDSGPKERLQQC